MSVLLHSSLYQTSPLTAAIDALLLQFGRATIEWPSTRCQGALYVDSCTDSIRTQFRSTECWLRIHRVRGRALRSQSDPQLHEISRLLLVEYHAANYAHWKGTCVFCELYSNIDCSCSWCKCVHGALSMPPTMRCRIS